MVIIGGCGHAGLPLAIAFADRGLSVIIFDIDEAAVAQVNAAVLPFDEVDGAAKLGRAVARGVLRASTDPSVVALGANVIVVVGTPIDDDLRPDEEAVPRALRTCLPYLHDGQLLVLRSTVMPGVTRTVEEMLDAAGLAVDVAFCPERISQGNALTELFELPQLVSGRNEASRGRAAKLFGLLTEHVIELEPEEAELAKLFTNTWRYLKFAAVNEFFTIADRRGLDFERIRQALMQDYPRAADMPPAGFAAGPCLLKDTMQLAAFTEGTFALGLAAMRVNEGLPDYVVSTLERDHDLTDLTVGILGAAFKAESDDIRSSLAYRLKAIAATKARRVLMTDPYVTVDPDLVPVEQVLAEADVLVVATPHAQYRGLRTDKPVADVWCIIGRNS